MEWRCGHSPRCVNSWPTHILIRWFIDVKTKPEGRAYPEAAIDRIHGVVNSNPQADLCALRRYELSLVRDG